MIELYAHPASQPSRSVLWLCALNKIPAQLHYDPTKNLSDLNPRAQIPVLVDGDFTLSEMPAILAYLADMHNWSDWYPQNLQSRARIQQYLHAHHTLTRLATLKLMAPHVLVAFEAPPTNNPTSVLSNAAIASAMTDEHKLATGQNTMRAVIAVIEAQYLAGPGDFIGGLHKPSIADLACYEEIAQLLWANLFTLEQFPATSKWLGEMAALPQHEPMHRYNLALGDIATEANTMKRMMSAIDEGLHALTEVGFSLDQG